MFNDENSEQDAFYDDYLKFLQFFTSIYLMLEMFKILEVIYAPSLLD